MRRALACLALVAALGACGRSERATPPCACDDARPVDTALVAWLSRARSLHHVADLAEETNDVAGALAALDKLASGTIPGGATPPPEVDEVLADTFARVAEIDSRRGAFDDAERAVARGLEKAREPTYFRGHLLEVSGVAHERRAKSLAAAGDAAGAARERDLAAKASLEAVDLQEQVIRRATSDAGAR